MIKILNKVRGLNADTEHHMRADFDNYENTGIPDVFDEDNLDENIDNLNDWD